jgi:hypothetical protein
VKTKFLFPNKFIKIGWILIGLSVVIVLLNTLYPKNELLTHLPVFCIYDSGVPLLNPSHHNPIMEIKFDDINFEVISILFILGCLFIGFSSLKLEDEFTMKLRLESLLWSMYLNFLIFMLSIIFIYGIVFIWIPFFSLLAFLIIYIIRFYYVLYKSIKIGTNEK